LQVWYPSLGDDPFMQEDFLQVCMLVESIFTAIGSLSFCSDFYCFLFDDIDIRTHPSYKFLFFSLFQMHFYYVPFFSWIQSWNLIARCIPWDFYQTWASLSEFLRECHFRQAQSFRVLSLHPRLRLYYIACSVTSFRYCWSWLLFS